MNTASSDPVAGAGDDAERRPAGLLLTGGASRRMGFAKGTLEVDGTRLSPRLADLLTAVTVPSLEVGPGYSGLPRVAEEIPGRGPVAAIVAGWETCRAVADPRSVLVLACDLPLMTLGVLRWLALRPGDRSMVPVVAGLPQPLCARWSSEDVERMAAALDKGTRSFEPIYGLETVTFLDESSWGAVTDARVFTDADTLDDLERLGLARAARPIHLDHQR
ncbi:MAG: molybdenum cofactor guanylyltransferase [Acidimicrobiales bacterium]